MSFDIFKSVFLVADSLARISFAKLLDQTFGLSRNSEGEGNRVNSLQNELVNVHVVFGVERSFAAKQLENENAKAPQIGRDVVAAVRDDLERGLIKR